MSIAIFFSGINLMAIIALGIYIVLLLVANKQCLYVVKGCWKLETRIEKIVVTIVNVRHCPSFCVNRKLQDSGFILESCFQI